MRGIEKSFPGVKALRGVDLTLHGGEVLALLGENGAGKSTLIKMLGGAHRPDVGEIDIEGDLVHLDHPSTAISAGIGVIYQEFNLVPALTARENIFLGRESGKFVVRRREEWRRTEELFIQIGASIPMDVPVAQLSTAQQQMVEIAKALSQDVRILVMDEPSAALTPQEVEKLFAVIRSLRQRGIGIIYISHRLDEVPEIADRVMVLRDGANVGVRPIDEIDRETIIQWMVGRKLENEFPPRDVTIGECRVAIRGLQRRPAVQAVDLEIRRGEILGVTGLVGAGRTELARIIFGADRATGGTVTLDGRTLTIGCPADAIRQGICLLTEDRKHQGLVLGLSCRENFALPNLARFSRLGWVSRGAELRGFQKLTDRLMIKLSSAEQRVGDLSGGNQQKVVLAKWLARDAEFLIFDEPTRGVDVGAKFEIYSIMNALAAEGKAIMMISSELPEVLGMSDRIMVMHDGRVTGVLDADQATQKQLMELAVG